MKIDELINRYLLPKVRKVDQEAFYAKDYIVNLGVNDYFTPSDTLEETLIKRISVVEETAKYCMTTAFCLWCHFSVMTYISQSENNILKKEVLPSLQNGTVIGGTALSNPMKYFTGIEELHLKADKVADGYIINGSLPAISNLGTDHVFAFIAAKDELDNNGKEIMGLISCQTEGLTLKQRLGYIGLNGSATYTCIFKDVFIEDSQIIATNAEEFVHEIRTHFVAYQIPLGLGVIKKSIESIQQVSGKNDCLNQYLPTQADHLSQSLEELINAYKREIKIIPNNWEALLKIRLEVVYLALKSAETAMIHQGGAGYIEASSASRRLREVYFLVNLTPTVKHLEKMLKKDKHKQNYKIIV